MLKFVLDTNVLVSALISGKGNPALLLDKAAEKYTLFISKDILIEFEDVISWSEHANKEPGIGGAY